MCVVLPVWDSLLHVHVHQLCQVLYVAHLGGLQWVNLEFGHGFLSELLLAALLQLLPQGDDVSNAGPEALERSWLLLKSQFAAKQCKLYLIKSDAV